MSIDKKNVLDIIVLAIIALVLIIGYNKIIKPETIEKQVTETETIDIKQVVEEAINNQLQLQQPTQQPVIVYRDRVVPIHDNTVIPEGDLDKVKQLNKYQDTTRLDNGTIYSQILSDGIVYSNKITADIPVKTITKTKETKITKYASGLFISPGINANRINGIDNIEIGLNYIYKADFGVGAAVQYDMNTNSINWGIKLHKKIF